MPTPQSSRQAPLFDAYLMVDWSANSKPKSGKDSIWYFLLHRPGTGRETVRPSNPKTRQKAYEDIHALLVEQVAAGQRTLVGFDFPYGYPSGFAEALALLGQPWSAVWNELRRLIKDDEHNKNDRFEQAAKLNCRLGKGKELFWACPSPQKGPWLSTHKPKPRGDRLDELRITDKWLHGPQSPWKLYAPGSVGSQALLGIPRLAELRHTPELASLSRVWPFETGLRAPDFQGYSIVHAEIYPSLIPVDPKPDQIKDAEQVKALAHYFHDADEKGDLRVLFEGPATLTKKQRQQVEDEEGWILGVGAQSPAIV